MIVVNDSSPRWIRELDRFIHLKSMLLVHGNVLDLVSYQVQSGEHTYWTEGNLAHFFERLLMEINYEVVGVFDPLDGLTFSSETMEKEFEQIIGGKRSKTEVRRGQPKNELVDALPAVADISKALANRDKPCAFVVNFASRLISSPENLSHQEQALFTRILKASLESKEVIREQQRWNNVLILVCDKINDLPAFVYLNNPRSRSLYLDKPGVSERSRFVSENYRSFYSSAPGQSISPELPGLFSALTEGFSYYEMLSLIGLSLREQIPLEQIQSLCERFKYGIVESDWDKLDRNRLNHAGDMIRSRIKGQEAAVIRLLEIIKRAKMGLEAGSAQKSQRPRGVLFFAGPTGVGKTEMAKGLAELLFGQEERLIRFDMSEYASAHADQKLLGAPPGYVGYEEGGKLTNAIKQQPFSVLLFDEIEKAHGSIFDKFLQILDDGRLTDGKGETVYFSECIIIFTSNLGTYALNDNQTRSPLISPEQPYNQVKETILNAIRQHFNQVLGRPEILNRFGENFVVFDFIRPPVDELIVDRLLSQLLISLKEQQGIHLKISASVRKSLYGLSKAYLEHGGRGVRNMIDAALINPLATALFEQNYDDHTRANSIIHLQQLIDQGKNEIQRFKLELIIADAKSGTLLNENAAHE